MQIQWRWDNVGGLGEHVTCHMLVSYISFCFIIRLSPSLHRRTSFDDLYVRDLFPSKRNALWGSRSYCSQHPGSYPKKKHFGT